MLLITLLLLVLWFIPGVIAYGLTLGFFQGKYPTVRDELSDTEFAFFIGMCGPIGLIGVGLPMLLEGELFKYGLKFKAEGPTR